MPYEKINLWQQAQYQAKIIPCLYTKQAKHKAISNLLATLRNALNGGA